MQLYLKYDITYALKIYIVKLILNENINQYISYLIDLFMHACLFQCTVMVLLQHSIMYLMSYLYICLFMHTLHAYISMQLFFIATFHVMFIYLL